MVHAVCVLVDVFARVVRAYALELDCWRLRILCERERHACAFVSEFVHRLERVASLFRKAECAVCAFCVRCSFANELLYVVVLTGYLECRRLLEEHICSVLVCAGGFFWNRNADWRDALIFFERDYKAFAAYVSDIVACVDRDACRRSCQVDFEGAREFSVCRCRESLESGSFFCRAQRDNRLCRILSVFDFRVLRI